MLSGHLIDNEAYEEPEMSTSCLARWRAVRSTRRTYQTLCSSSSFKKKYHRASLVAQWLRVCLPVQGTRVRALVWEDPTCHGATRPVSHNY